MPLRLILIRHAKSDWDNPLDTDHARPLNARGRRAAPMVGTWLAAQGHVPGQVLVSDAVRTRQTWDLIAPALPGPPEVTFLPALYHASAGQMQRCLSAAQADTVLMIGHNPGIAYFAAGLLARPPAHADFQRYPTCATLVADFDAADWGQIGTGTCVDFKTPRDLGPR
ncbi:SixA phosphatase family protein [Roseicitreum antarcticum]|uniref:Phosphohistidine phosphatase n=1 Tax=Roseicitreum antarcticum TaxID=564137 RepID=A0A1H2X4P8_9RHOB|nr:histidine phosphatase family protein [Roseicitreum antarcticum]SDW87795.1 phosphohistidine phosphatase [Roseicitreum antarcticum]